METDVITALSEVLTVQKILLSLAVFAAAWGVVKVTAFLVGMIAHRFPRYRFRILFAGPVVGLAVWPIAVYLVAVNVLTLPETTLFAILGALGLAFGLAVQDPLRNAISGVLILFDRPFSVGDMVGIGSHYGEVVRIGLRNVWLKTFDDSVVVVPSTMITSSVVSNSNSGAISEMVVVKLMLPGFVDPADLKKRAWEAAASSPYVFLKKPITILFGDEFRTTFLTELTIKVYVIDARLERLCASDVFERTKSALIQAGVFTEDLLLGPWPRKPMPAVQAEKKPSQRLAKPANAPAARRTKKA